MKNTNFLFHDLKTMSPDPHRYTKLRAFLYQNEDSSTLKNMMKKKMSV